MTFKVTVVNKFSENVLHKGRNGAGVKAELFFIRFDKMFRKHHVSDTKRGRDRFGKGMKKEYRCTLRTKKMIRAAFVELLGEKKNMETITVGELAERADIAKSTFYNTTTTYMPWRRSLKMSLSPSSRRCYYRFSQ